MLAHMKPGLIIALTFFFSLLVGGSGCGKSHESVKSGGTVSAPPAQATQAAESAAPSEVTPIVISDNGDTAAALAQLTQAVRKYSFEHRKVPKTLEEVTSAGYVTAVPQAPAGKKFSFDPKKMEVVLVNR